MPSLFVIQGRDQGKRFELGQGPVSVGRDVANTIQLHDTEVSRRHAEFRSEGDAVVVVDLDSSNGTFINSQEVSSQQLRSGDRILIGKTLLIFTAIEDHQSQDLSDAIDIVTPHPAAGGSRIVKSVSQEQSSRMFTLDDPAADPWLARARSNLQVMYRTALAVSHTLDIDQLLTRIMELIFEWVEADRGVVMLVSQETGELEPAVRHYRKNESSTERIEISRTILEYVQTKNEGVLTSDARDDERWEPGGSIVRMGVREAICVPLQGRYGVVGVIYIDTYTPPGRVLHAGTADRFSEEHLKLMVAIGHQAALAVEDTSYYSAMVQAERLAAMGQTIAMLSHHIKNILQGIRGGSYLIEEGLKTDTSEVVRKGWTIVEKNQEKISNLVMDMLSFSKEREPEMVVAVLNDVVEDVVELMQSRAQDLEVVLRWEPAETIPELMFDPEALHRAILNVVTNALDASSEVEAPCVKVSTGMTADGKHTYVAVEDNGEGIAEDDIKRIFSVFESRKGARGTGLGLPVSQKIMQEHNGDIEVTSQRGAGSRFVLKMPAVLATSSGSGDTLG
ncbi:MAG: histidine kinase [Blastopirellula sp.]|nr:histidine kinase [Blastopirellula sp.]